MLFLLFTFSLYTWPWRWRLWIFVWKFILNFLRVIRWLESIQAHTRFLRLVRLFWISSNLVPLRFISRKIVIIVYIWLDFLPLPLKRSSLIIWHHCSKLIWIHSVEQPLKLFLRARVFNCLFWKTTAKVIKRLQNCLWLSFLATLYQTKYVLASPLI